MYATFHWIFKKIWKKHGMIFIKKFFIWTVGSYCVHFKVIIENTNDFIAPVCLIQCICGGQIKLYLKHYRFQRSNFTKHLKTINNTSSFFINNKNQELDDPQVLDQTDSDDQLLRNESNRLITQNNSIG